MADREPAGPTAVLRPRRVRRGVAIALVAATLLPLAAVFAALSGRRWVPAGDEAAMLLGVEEVGRGRWPLVGVYSIRRWAHPGPALTYAAVVPFRVLGSGPVDLFRAAVVIDAGALVAVGALAWRRRGLLGVALATAFASTLLIAMGPSMWVQIWNPNLALLPFLALLVAIWGVGERDWVLLPVAAGLATFVVQLHVAYLPLVATAGAAALAVAVAAPTTTDRPRWPGRRPLALAAVVVAVMWLPPFVDQVAGTHNASRVASYFVHGQQDPVGARIGVGIVASHLRLVGPWSGGPEGVLYNRALTESPIHLVPIVVAVAAAIVVGLRRRAPIAGPAIALSQLVTAGWAAARLEPPLLRYLSLWLLPLGAFCWWMVVQAAIDTARARTRRPGTVALAIGAVLVAVTGVQVTRGVVRAGDVELPRQDHADAVLTVLDELDGHLDDGATYRIEGRGDPRNEAWVGVVYGLVDADVDVVTPDGAAGQKWGVDRRPDDRPIDAVLTVASSPKPDAADWIERCRRDPAVREIATHDELTAAERDRAEALRFSAYVAADAVTPAERTELAALEARGFRMSVFVGAAPCRP